MNSLHIRMLGSVCFSRSGMPDPIAISRKVQSLICYLVLFRQCRHSREKLAGLFWFDQPAEKARSCLNTALWRARRSLAHRDAPSYLVTSPSGDVAFNSSADYWCDAQVFEASAAKALAPSDQTCEPELVERLEACAALYRGDLLEGVYDDWALSERLRLSDLYERILQRLMTVLIASGALDRAVHYGNLLIAADPLREDIHRSLMELHHRQGHFHHCRRQYEQCREAVERELQCQPLEETNRLYRRLVARTTSALTEQTKAAKEQDGYLDKIRHSLSSAQDQLNRASKLLDRLITH